MIPGTVPNPTDWPIGCRFHARCPYGWDRCVKEAPPLLQVRTKPEDPLRVARCWLEENPARRAEIQARGAFGVNVSGAPAPAEQYHREAARRGEVPPPEPSPPEEPPGAGWPEEERQDAATQQQRRGEAREGGRA